jgi:beta-N-acetylhexosaminidase
MITTSTFFAVSDTAMKKRIVQVLVLLFFIIPSIPGFASMQPDSLSIKVGQMLMIGFRGSSVGNAPEIAADINQYHIGGIVLFDYDVPAHSPQRNIISPQQLSNLTNELQKLSNIPLFIAIDQEGGKVNRLKKNYGFPASMSAEYLGKLNNPDSTTASAAKTARTLREMHITMNLAPVADLNTNPDNPVIGKLGRSFSSVPATVTSNLMYTFRAYHRNGIISTLKHFPGHGSSTKDTHLDFTDVTATWSAKELEPYRDLIASGFQDAIMTAHVFNGNLDPLYPATLSKATLTDLLRNNLKFKGVIVSDDMQMKSIADHYGLETAIRLAIEAGVDILIFANNTTYDPAITSKAAAIIHSLLQKKIITPERINQSFQRIIQLKERYTQ